MVATAPGFVPIADYGAIGDCRSAALISRDGSIDWLCLPNFANPSVFAAILDPKVGGHFSIRPCGAFRTSRRYVENTNVLETTFTTESGTLVLTDSMPVADERHKEREMLPEREVLRRVECTRGAVRIEVECRPRPGYGAGEPRLLDEGGCGLRFRHPHQPLHLLSEIPLHAFDAAARGEIELRKGERRFLSLTYAEEEPAVLAPLGDHAQDRLDRTIRWWQAWLGSCTYEGVYRDAVLRSVLALKLMAFAPSGAVVAAPTTSLPEVPGGGSNWDYRYCWLRDASLTMRALLGLGFDDEAAAFLDWLLHATHLTAPRLQVMYDVWGRHRLPERELAHLRGYVDSRPVRVGNAAWTQFQLDVYGPVIGAAYEFIHAGGVLDSTQRKYLADFERPLLTLWDRPDDGIWELRSGARHHTFSKAMAWVGLDRLLRLHRRGEIRLRSPGRVESARERLRTRIDAAGFDPRLGSYTSVFGEPAPDASLLILIVAGYLEPGSLRARGTLEYIRGTLGAWPHVYRFPQAEKPEGAFGICSFWAVEAEAMTGEIGAAKARFEALLACANDLGLYAEEIDPATGAHLGNFPQAFTHVGLIDAALSLDTALQLGPRAAAYEHDHPRPHRRGWRPAEKAAT